MNKRCSPKKKKIVGRCNGTKSASEGIVGEVVDRSLITQAETSLEGAEYK